MAKRFRRQDKASPTSIIEELEEEVSYDFATEKECFLALLSSVRSHEMNESDFKRTIVRVKRASVWASDIYRNASAVE